MPIDTFAVGVIETGFNQLLKESADTSRLMMKLKGKILAVTVVELEKQLFFVFSHQVDILTNFEGEPDCRLTLNLSILPELRDKNNITQLIQQGRLVLDGELQTAQDFSLLLSMIKPDIEELLSRYTGDIVAHKLVRSAKQGKQFIESQHQKQVARLARVVTDEWQLAPSRLEALYHFDQIEDISEKVSILEARLNKISETL
ncbi:SCP2 sterol-binding domain-containing protein [Vibrio sp. SS-MA-C1-2]|uniref:ubiquinone biosynthesis accessory factor UbiJ n=1 Tax=Vibrio sp. SS-MA-C1-2 TaxID=2908646 RepID=UPI001F2C23E3|nr:SCP2 sterol-binding domain-containing protein [Vibrio sp. SS-MA-C1-2]UJF19372.1 SCP2 sterol-binding domain-containing protein [Vibrio sp. SS-MA-C1-2]